MSVGSGVYFIRNIANDKVYIGSSVNVRTRFRQHLRALRAGKHGNDHLQKSWNKYGEERFHFELVEIVEPLKLAEREQYYIDSKMSYLDSHGYNLEKYVGLPMLGRKFSSESRAKMSESHKGQVSGKKGVKLSEETKEKLRKANFGRKASAETKLKMSEWQKGKKLSLQRKLKMKDIWKKRKGVNI